MIDIQGAIFGGIGLSIDQFAQRYPLVTLAAGAKIIGADLDQHPQPGKVLDLILLNCRDDNMSQILAKRDLLADLAKKSEALGLTVHDDAQEGCSGEVEAIGAKWWFGGRKVAYRMSCRLTESDHTGHFREAAVKRSSGFPPPTLTVETTSTRGWKRTDVSVGGGGSLNYGQVRQAVEQATVAAGWNFHLEVGRMP